MTSVRYVCSADGTRIAYRVSGSGDPVLLVHGASTSSGDWAFVVPFLRDRFTVVAMDRRGRAQSGDGSPYAIGREAEDVLAVADAVGAELLVGHSYGALCSILAAERFERLRGLVLYEPPIGIRGDRFAGLEELVARGELDAAVERNVEKEALTPLLSLQTERPGRPPAPTWHCNIVSTDSNRVKMPPEVGEEIETVGWPRG